MERWRMVTLENLLIAFVSGAAAFRLALDLAGSFGFTGPGGGRVWSSLGFFGETLFSGFVRGGFVALRLRLQFFSRRSGAGGRRARESLVLAGFVGCLMVPCCSAAAALSLLLSSVLFGLAAWLHP